MRLVTYLTQSDSAGPGVLAGELVFNLQPAGFADTLGVIAGGVEARAAIDAYLRSLPASAGEPIDRVTLLAPLPRPPKFICVGLNYLDHAMESKLEIPGVPTIFSKFSYCIIGPGAPIVLPRNSTKPDYEAELAFVIGTGGRRIAADEWRRHVYGYLCVNDVSARDFQMATSQWLMGKTFDTFAPTGPWLTTADEIEDPHQLDIRMEINGELLQSSNTRNLIFKIPQLIEYISSVVALEPGDIISTGTPAGVGCARQPPRWLKPGDEAVVTVHGLGSLSNPVTAEA
ncbi:fumarylacetoacetate hydrolase family protein [Paludibaculum fermentans]|uniref:fumarylacetoacetate hydrolase family protein n=1 Tax=Paludibaculum fermentans TaxID=1473598 RepID=UPI003EBCCA8C